MKKRRLKGGIIGGIIGILFSLIFIKYGTSENIFRLPVILIIKFYCLFIECSDVFGYALGLIIITILFYTLIGSVLGIVILNIIKKRK